MTRESLNAVFYGLTVQCWVWSINCGSTDLRDEYEVIELSSTLSRNAVILTTGVMYRIPSN